MITDVFFRRYEDLVLWSAFRESERRFLGQAAQLITSELLKRSEKEHKERPKDPAIVGQEAAHRAIERELGLEQLTPRYWFRDISFQGSTRQDAVAYLTEKRTANFLTAPFNETSSPDLFIKFRISFIEVAFQVRSAQLTARRASLIAVLDMQGSMSGEQLFEAMSDQHIWASTKRKLVEDETAFAACVHELNERFRQAKMPLSYHNNLIQVSDDALIEQEIERPFWSLASDPKWAVVDQQMKEALDQRDSGDRNAVSNALNALESTIKTISNDKGWTTGHERGAANYIDNLVKERNGDRFIQVWEKDVLVKLFSDIRNLFGHGPAAGQPLPSLLPQQTAWAIDTCMVWIKSLIQRA